MKQLAYFVEALSCTVLLPAIWQTVVTLFEPCGSAAPLLHGMQLALALAQQLAVLVEAPHMIMVTCGAVAFDEDYGGKEWQY